MASQQSEGQHRYCILHLISSSWVLTRSLYVDPPVKRQNRSLPSHLETTLCTLSFALLKQVVDGSLRLPHIIVSRTRTLEIQRLGTSEFDGCSQACDLVIAFGVNIREDGVFPL